VSEVAVRIDHLNYSHRQGKHERQVLNDISVQFMPGGITVLTGPSGSGKSTLLTIIGGLRQAIEGSVSVLGTELVGAKERHRVALRRQIGFIFQQHNLAPALTVRQNVLMGLQLGPKLSRRDRRARVEEAVTEVGLAEHIDKYPSQLSGGQQQRAGIARALVTHPRLVLADEPTASLDRDSGQQVMHLLSTLAEERETTVLLVTHDKRILEQSHALVTLEDGTLVQPSDGLLHETSSAVRTMRNLESGRLGQLFSFGHALAQVALADGELVDAEIAVIRDRLSKSGTLSNAELEFVMEMVIAMAEGWMKQQASDERRAALAAALEDVARADHDFRPEERAVIDSLLAGPQVSPREQ
jgi:putative ABC transport system ATP-binding protein